MRRVRQVTYISAEEFIRIWQCASNLPAAAKELGMNIESASRRAYHYRQKGIPLKYFRRAGRAPLDYVALAILANELRGDDETADKSADSGDPPRARVERKAKSHG